MTNMKSQQLKVQTQVRAGAVPCTNTTYPYLQCYIGKQQNGAAEPERISGAMSVGNCLNTVKALSSDYRCYVA